MLNLLTIIMYKFLRKRLRILKGILDYDDINMTSLCLNNKKEGDFLPEVKTLWKYINAEYLGSVLENGIYVSKLSEVNDPYEYKFMCNIDRFRICCVSNRKGSISKYMLSKSYR